MEYREGVCPKCGKNMQIPEDMEKVICMYCGEPFSPEDPAARERDIDVGLRDRYKEAAAAAFPMLLLSVQDGLKGFKRDTYEEVFRQMYRQNIDLLSQIENMYLLSPDGEQDIRDLCAVFVDTVRGEMEQVKRKSLRDRMQTDHNMTMVIYVIPQILEYKGESSALLAEELLKAWNGGFKNTKLGMATFEEINAGFRKKLCYITTAVCESLNRSEDCEELALLKDYRDRVLLGEEGGRELIDRYYDIAPTIVKRINKRPEREELYRGIYRQYIGPCICAIKQKDYQGCKGIYTQMVETLVEEYMR